MENLIKQRRVSFSESGQPENKDSFKDMKLSYGFHRGNSQDYDDSFNSDSSVAAIAAATFAIHSLEEKMTSQHQKKEKTREEVEASMRTRTSQAAKVSSFARPSRSREPYVNRNLSIHGSGNTKIDAWEKAELLKIQIRYEKSKKTILEWENEKKSRAERRVEEKKKELDQRRSINWQHYQNKLARIDHIAGGAQSQAEEKKRKDEKKVKERAKEMRSLGVSSPKYCFLC